MWFENLTGFSEISPNQVRENLDIIENRLVSKVNSKEFIFGKLEVLSLAELRKKSKTPEDYNSEIQVMEAIGNIQTFHKKELNNGAFLKSL